MSTFAVALLCVIVVLVVVGLACDCWREWHKWQAYQDHLKQVEKGLRFIHKRKEIL